MSLSSSELETAKVQAEEARKRLAATMVAMQARLNPKALAREAVQELRETGEEFAKSGAAAMKRHAGPIAGIAATIGLVLARHQVGGLISHFTGGDETVDEPESSTTKSKTSERGKTS